MSDTVKIHASEALHWYTREGLPMYTVTAKNGKERSATLRDARKFVLVPSYSNVAMVAARPGLENWKQKQVLLAALTLPQVEGESDADWCKRIIEDSREHAKKAADRGVAVHTAIEDYFATGEMDDKYIRHTEGVVQALGKWMPAADWKPEIPFAHPYGFGGKADLVCASPEVVVDFKTKEFDENDPLATWDDHEMQLAAYRAGLRMCDARCAVVYISVSNPGLVRLLEVPEDKLDRGWNMFLGLLSYWKAMKKYDPGF